MENTGEKRKTFKSKKRHIDEPITSYGLIPFHIVFGQDSKTIEGIYFLLEQRRDTFAYIEVIRSTWRSEAQIPSYFSLMCVEERQRIREYVHQELYDDLHIERNSKMYREMYHKAKKRYESIRHLIPNILDTTQACMETPPWGFPKGKKNHYKETDIDCALRETEEETRITKEHIKVLEPACHYSEKYQGTNGKMYATHYYLAEIDEMIIPSKMPTPHCIRKDTISEEVGALKWATYPEACKYLSPRRQLILLEALGEIRKLYGKHTIHDESHEDKNEVEA